MHSDYVPILAERFAAIVPALHPDAVASLAAAADEVLREHAYYDWVAKSEANALLVRANSAEADRDRAHAVVGRLLAMMDSAGLLRTDATSLDYLWDAVRSWIESGRAEVARFWASPLGSGGGHPVPGPSGEDQQAIPDPAPSPAPDPEGC